MVISLRSSIHVSVFILRFCCSRRTSHTNPSLALIALASSSSNRDHQVLWLFPSVSYVIFLFICMCFFPSFLPSFSRLQLLISSPVSFWVLFIFSVFYLISFFLLQLLFCLFFYALIDLFSFSCISLFTNGYSWHNQRPYLLFLSFPVQKEVLGSNRMWPNLAVLMLRSNNPLLKKKTLTCWFCLYGKSIFLDDKIIYPIFFNSF